MIPAHETFDGIGPFEPRFFDGSGFRQHYVDEGRIGEGADNVIVLILGEPNSGLFKPTGPSMARQAAARQSVLELGCSRRPDYQHHVERDVSRADNC